MATRKRRRKTKLESQLAKELAGLSESFGCAVDRKDSYRKDLETVKAGLLRVAKELNIEGADTYSLKALSDALPEITGMLRRERDELKSATEKVRQELLEAKARAFDALTRR